MTKAVVFYHANCTDGFGAAYAAWTMLGGDAEYVPLNYGEIKTLDDVKKYAGEDIGRDTRIYILDFSLPKDVFYMLLATCGQVVWLDHHKSAFDMMEAVDINTPYISVGQGHFVLLDNSRSGALIAWDYFNDKQNAPILIQHIDDRDRWQFKIPGTKEVNAALRVEQPWSFEQWDKIVCETDDSVSAYLAMVDKGAALIAAQEQAVEQSVRNAREVTILGRTGLAVNTDHNMSEVGHALANKSGTFGLVWYVGADGSAKCSLRSNDDYDVTEIARNWGGGGHKNAAGMQVSVLNVLSWLKVEG